MYQEKDLKLKKNSRRKKLIASHVFQRVLDIKKKKRGKIILPIREVFI